MGKLKSCIYDVSVDNPRGDELKFLKSHLVNALTNEGFEVRGKDIYYESIKGYSENCFGEIILDSWDYHIVVFKKTHGSGRLETFASSYRPPTDDEREKAAAERAEAEQTRQMDCWIRHGRP